ncbi:phage terminase large subunit [Ottowia testudinis]|uniref:Phage terminase large subunit n=1 Tax=Ottowia testudinis TaxID=2816950 RepID=A0A975CLF0_9BURK|nr:phage terminase large subunit [Ottowia testudinis]QTD46349.1 phage terminase large subunit [Ottowia testudinis]
MTTTHTPFDSSLPNKVTELQASLAALASDFPTFVRAAFATLYPGKLFMENWHIDAMAHALEGCIEGTHRRLIINVPPRHLKSFITSVAFPAFVLGMDPTAKIIVASYSDDLAKPLALDFKRLVESTLYKQVFPKTVAMKSTEGEFRTSLGGARLALSVGGSLTGKGADFIIVDDPLKAQDAASDKERQRVNRWFGETLYSRLDDKKHSVLIVVMQRLHVNDLTGYLLQGQAEADKVSSLPVAANDSIADPQSAKGQQASAQVFRNLCLPAIAPKTETFALSKVKTHTRQVGDLLHPKLEDEAVLADLKHQMGDWNFAAQYQQAPQMPQGHLIKSKWIETVSELPADPGNDAWVLCIDAASSTKETADYSALVFMYVCQKGCFVIDVKRGRWDYETLKEIVRGYERRYGNRDRGPQFRYLVEDTSVGTALISELKAQGKSVFTDKPTSSKELRVYRTLPVLEKGYLKVVKHPELDSSWIEPFTAELVSFPNGRFDDQLDATVMGVHWANWHWTQHRWLREGAEGKRAA